MSLGRNMWNSWTPRGRSLVQAMYPLLQRLKLLCDVAGLIGLGVVALIIRGVRILRLYPIDWSVRSRLPLEHKKVVLFIPSLGLGGAQRQLVSFLTHLNRDKWHPEILTLDRPDKFFELDIRSLDVPVVYLNKDAKSFLKIVLVWKLVRYLYHHPCHVLHAWMHYALALGSIAGTIAGIPAIVGSVRCGRPSRFPWHFPKWQRTIDMLTAPLHTGLIANSESVKQEHHRWAGIPKHRISVIYNGIDFPREEIQKEIFPPEGLKSHSTSAPVSYIGIVGRLDPEKDHETFLHAAKRICSVVHNTEFLVLGEGPLRLWIEAESIRLGLSARVRFLGSRKDVFSVMRSMKVLVLTSTHEGFPNVLLEAAVAGIPVVTTSAGGVTEFVVNEETGFVVPCGDAEAVAEKVLTLLNDPMLGQRMAQASFERITSYFSATHTTQQVEDLYEKSLQAPIVARNSSVRVCFISSNVFGLIWPSGGINFGGAEVQIYTLMKELGRIPGFSVSVLTRGGASVTHEQKGILNIYSHCLLGQPGEKTDSGEEMGSEHSVEGEQSQRTWEWAVLNGTNWLNEKPIFIQKNVRTSIRTIYSIRRWLKSWTMLGTLSRTRREWMEVLKWVRVLHQVKADIFVMRCASPIVGYLSIACRLLRKKFVYMVAHDMDVSGEYVQTHGKEGQWYESGLRHAHARVCQHAAQADMIAGRYTMSATLIRSLCPVEVSEPSRSPSGGVLWIARVDSWKQPEIFLELARRIPDLSFVMVAPPSEVNPENLEQIKEAVKSLPNLRLLPTMTLESTNALFQQSMVFVNTSLVEGFPNTFLQSAAQGVPIVSWAVNPDSIFDQNEFGFCAEQSWPRFEQYVRRLCADNKMRMRLGQHGNKYILQNHSSLKIGRQYADLFLSMTEKRNFMCRGYNFPARFQESH